MLNRILVILLVNSLKDFLFIISYFITVISNLAEISIYLYMNF